MINFTYPHRHQKLSRGKLWSKLLEFRGQIMHQILWDFPIKKLGYYDIFYGLRLSLAGNLAYLASIQTVYKLFLVWTQTLYNFPKLYNIHILYCVLYIETRNTPPLLQASKDITVCRKTVWEDVVDDIVTEQYFPGPILGDGNWFDRCRSQ